MAWRRERDRFGYPQCWRESSECGSPPSSSQSEFVDTLVPIMWVLNFHPHTASITHPLPLSNHHPGSSPFPPVLPLPSLQPARPPPTPSLFLPPATSAATMPYASAPSPTPNSHIKNTRWVIVLSHHAKFGLHRPSRSAGTCHTPSHPSPPLPSQRTPPETRWVTSLSDASSRQTGPNPSPTPCNPPPQTSPPLPPPTNPLPPPSPLSNPLAPLPPASLLPPPVPHPTPLLPPPSSASPTPPFLRSLHLPPRPRPNPPLTRSLPPATCAPPSAFANTTAPSTTPTPLIISFLGSS